VKFRELADRALDGFNLGKYIYGPIKATIKSSEVKDLLAMAIQGANSHDHPSIDDLVRDIVVEILRSVERCTSDATKLKSQAIFSHLLNRIIQNAAVKRFLEDRPL